MILNIPQLVHNILNKWVLWTKLRQIVVAMIFKLTYNIVIFNLYLKNIERKYILMAIP